MPRSRGLIITIDGLVGSGKSSTARRVASKLQYRHIDTGAMYRCITLAALRAGVKAADRDRLVDLLGRTHIDLKPESEGGRVLLDGEDVSREIRKPEITSKVAGYADEPLVRQALIRQQQKLGVDGGVVAEGRDAGTVVFPDADVKVLMTASFEERSKRRHRELADKGISVSLNEVRRAIGERDETDATRDYGATHEMDKIHELNTTTLTFEEQVEQVISWAREAEQPAAGEVPSTTNRQA